MRAVILGALLLLSVAPLPATPPAIAEYTAPELIDYLVGVWELRLPRAVVRYAEDAPRVVYPRESRSAVVGSVVIHPNHLLDWHTVSGIRPPGVGAPPVEVRSFAWSVVQRPDGRNVLVVSESGSIVSSWSCWVIDDDTVALIAPPHRFVYPNNLLLNSYLTHRIGRARE